jgi:hypothetical protein
VNPFNPEAGETPAPDDPVDLAFAELSAKVIWRAFPYFAWRYGERGARFGRSDAGYLVTLADVTEDLAITQIDWLAKLLAARGMPSVLLEYQLEHLARLASRQQRPSEPRLRSLAAHLRRRRSTVMPVQVVLECERLCRAAAAGQPRRHGVGRLIAFAVADGALGFGAHDQALVRWFSDTDPDDLAWARACAAARDLALSSVNSVAGSSR